MPIRAVVYASQAVEGLSIDRLEALVTDAARFNKLAGVTGVLLHDGTRFVQYFEGPEDGVASVYERVLQSTSHTDVVELARGRVSTRQFPYWSMHQLPADQLLVGRLARADWSRFKRSQPEEIAGSAWGIDVLAAAAKLDDCATAVDGISNQGAVSATVQEGDTYTIPAGYHNGSGTVSGVAGGGNYKLQSKTVAPTKAQQAITPDSGYYGLSDVTVSQIPDAYQDVSSVTAGAADTLTGKVLVTADGKVTTGTMPNNGAVSKTLDANTPSYTIPKGYHSGTGKVSVAVETKTVTPTKAAQDVVPSTGKVLTKVSVAAIPDEFVDTSSADALAANILDGKTAFVNGVKVTGSMPDNGSATATMDGLTSTSVTIPAGYTAGGTVSLTSDIEEALAAI